MNKAMVFDKFRKFETEFAGRPLVVETGKMTQLANGACLVRYGDTVVHVACTASEKPREGVDFFPLSVDYEEKMYSVGGPDRRRFRRSGRWRNRHQSESGAARGFQAEPDGRRYG